MQLHDAVQLVLDGLGMEAQRHVPVEEIKSRFFMLGLQVGVSLQVILAALQSIELHLWHRCSFLLS